MSHSMPMLNHYKWPKVMLKKQKKLLNEWKTAGDLSTNMGSRVHFELEKISG